MEKLRSSVLSLKDNKSQIAAKALGFVSQRIATAENYTDFCKAVADWCVHGVDIAKAVMALPKLRDTATDIIESTIQDAANRANQCLDLADQVRKNTGIKKSFEGLMESMEKINEHPFIKTKAMGAVMGVAKRKKKPVLTVLNGSEETDQPQ